MGSACIPMRPGNVDDRASGIHGDSVVAHRWLFAAWLVLVAGFILVTGSQLPATVASHFGAGGDADGFMPRAAYLGVMCVAGAALPAIIVIAQQRIMRKWPQRVNLPNREYWLAPQRREATVQAITRHLMLFGFGLSV